MYLVYDDEGFFQGMVTDAIEHTNILRHSDFILVKIPNYLPYDDDEGGRIFPKVETQYQ